MTAAPPAMSIFISSMPADGLMEMPPVSKVTALPTSPSTSRVRRADFGGRWRITIIRGCSAEPWATASRAPALRVVSSRGPSTSMDRLRRPRATFWARFARMVGVMWLDGVSASSRARLIASAVAPTAVAARDCSAPPATITAGSAARDARRLPVPERNASSLHAPVASPSAIARTSPASASAAGSRAMRRAPASRAARAAARPAAAHAPRSGSSPTPARSTRPAGRSPRVCSTRTWPAAPVTSPSAITADTRPPRDASTAARAPCMSPGGEATGTTSTSARIRDGSVARLVVTFMGVPIGCGRSR